MMGGLFALSGAVAGAAQAGSLARGAGKSPRPLTALGRVLVVAVVLFAAARAEQLALGATGWALGFAFAGVLAYRRLG